MINFGMYFERFDRELIWFPKKNEGFGTKFDWFSNKFSKILHWVLSIFSWISKDLVKNLIDFRTHSERFDPESKSFTSLVQNVFDFQTSSKGFRQSLSLISKQKEIYWRIRLIFNCILKNVIMNWIDLHIDFQGFGTKFDWFSNEF